MFFLQIREANTKMAIKKERGMKMEKIILNDVVLRDGAQVEGCVMHPDDQLAHVKNLIEGGIDVIEIGQPGSSDDQMKQCKKIVAFVDGMIKENPNLKRPILSALAMAIPEQIYAVKKAGCDMCHIYIPASDDLMSAQFDKEKYGDTMEGKRAWAVDRAEEMVRYAKSIGLKRVEYSPEDAARAGRDYILKISQRVVDAGVEVLNIPETTGLCIGNEFGGLIKYLMENVKGIKNVTLSVHCHNDTDCGTANAVQGLLNGALQVEGTFFGLGERSGMTKLESIVMIVNTRKDIFGSHHIDFEKSRCVETVNFIAAAIGMSVPRHWPVVGIQNVICSSGGHQAVEASRKENGRESAYYSWRPEDYGHCKVRTVINQSSGRGGVADKLKELGFAVSDEKLSEICLRVKRISETRGGKAVEERELVAITQDIIREIPYFMEVADSQVMGGKTLIPNSVITLSANDCNAVDSSVGNGALDAAMKAVHRTAKKLFPVLCKADIELDHWQAESITGGTEALAEAYCRIRVKFNGKEKVFAGRAIHLDTAHATAQAYANCLSWFLASFD